MRWDWVGIAFIGLFYFGLTDNARGPVYPHALNDLNISSAVGSSLFALNSLASLILTIFSLQWLKISTTVNWMRVSWVIVGVGVWLTGHSYSINSVPLFFIGAIVHGAGAGILGMCMNLLVTDGSSDQYRRKSYGALHATYGMASFIIPFIYTYCLNNQIHWSDFFKYMAYLPIFMLLMTIKTKGEKFIDNKDSAKVTSWQKSVHFGAFLGLYVASEIVVSSRLVYYLTETGRSTHEQASWYLSLFFIFLLLGRVSLAIFNIQLKGETILKYSLGISAILLVVGLLGTPFAFSLSALSMAYFFPCTMDMIGEKFKEEKENLIRASMIGVGVLLVIMHLSFGKFADHFGVEKAMSSALIFTILSFILLQTFIRKYVR